MEERLTIESFSGVPSLEVTLNDVNVLIGPQATGKSVVAKLLFFFKKFPEEMFSAAVDGKSPEESDSEYLELFEDLFGSAIRQEGELAVRYEAGDAWIAVRREAGELKLDYSEPFASEVRALRKKLEPRRVPGDSGAFSLDGTGHLELQHLELQLKELNERFAESIGPRCGFRQFFIPAGRAFFSLIQQSTFTLLSRSRHIDRSLVEFGSLRETLKRLYRMRRSADPAELARAAEDLDHLQKEILRGRYEQDEKNDRELIHALSGRRVELAHASSGQQEALPLAMALRYLPFVQLSARGSTIYIEEPEAHLFPSAQRLMIEMIARAFNVPRHELQFVITTHSPYTLTTLNNLMQAGAMYAAETSEKRLDHIRDILPRERTLRPEQVSVYLLQESGCEALKQGGQDLIDAEALDKVSEDLAVEFDCLLDIA